MTARQLGKALMHFLELFADLCIVSAYWLICCVPIVTVGASSAALYQTVVKVLRNRRGTLTRTFFGVFRETFKQGILLSLIFAGGCGLLLLYNLLGESVSSEAGYFVAYWAVVIILTVILSGTFVYVFPLLARFRQKTFVILRTAFYLSAGYPVKTMGLICLLLLSAWAVWNVPLLILILPGTLALLSSVIQEPILEKHTIEDESSSPRADDSDSKRS